MKQIIIKEYKRISTLVRDRNNRAKNRMQYLSDQNSMFHICRLASTLITPASPLTFCEQATPFRWRFHKAPPTIALSSVQKVRILKVRRLNDQLAQSKRASELHRFQDAQTVSGITR